jgi:hypothetical protein
MTANQSKLLPEFDPKHFSRNPKTAWLLYLDKLTAWLWQDNEGSARWTLILDDRGPPSRFDQPPSQDGSRFEKPGHPSVSSESGETPAMTSVMIILLLFLQKQSLASTVYLFGLGTLLTGPGLKKKAHAIMLSP